MGTGQAAQRVQLAAVEDSQVRSALEAQLEQLRAAHSTQLSELRDELAALQRQHQELKELVYFALFLFIPFTL